MVGFGGSGGGGNVCTFARGGPKLGNGRGAETRTLRYATQQTKKKYKTKKISRYLFKPFTLPQLFHSPYNVIYLVHGVLHVYIHFYESCPFARRIYTTTMNANSRFGTGVCASSWGTIYD
jgi:hypothetical protein